MEIAGVVVALVVVGGLVWLPYWLEQRRADFMERYAEKNDYVFDGTDDALLEELESFSCFSGAHSRQLRNVMTAVKPAGQVYLADYRWFIGRGGDSRQYEQTIVVVRTPGRSAADFLVRRRVRFLDAFNVEPYAARAIEVDQPPGFANAWHVSSAVDEERLGEFLSPALRRTLMTLVAKPLLIEARGDLLLVHMGALLIKHQHLDGLLADATGIRSHWSRSE